MKPDAHPWIRCLGALVLAAGAATHAAAQSTAPADEPAAPVDVVERLHAGLVELAAEAGEDMPLEQRIERLAPVIEATHALDYIAELTIRRAWSGLSTAERERFVAAFERLSVATYASRFAGLDGDPFRVLEAGEPERGRARVRAEIDPPDGDPVPLDYVLAERDGRWRIINIVADGVSDLALKRAEYTRILDDGGIDALVAELRAQVDAMR